MKTRRNLTYVAIYLDKSFVIACLNFHLQALSKNLTSS